MIEMVEFKKITIEMVESTCRRFISVPLYQVDMTKICVIHAVTE